MELTDDGGFFRLNVSRDKWKYHSSAEFEASTKALAHCERLGFKKYRVTKSEARGDFRYHYFKCVND